MTKVKEKLLECYVCFDPVVRVFLTSKCVLYSAVLTVWAGYGNTGALVNRGGEILQDQTTISNIHEIFFFTDMSYFLETRILLFKFLQKHFSKQVYVSNENNERDIFQNSFFRNFLYRISKICQKLKMSRLSMQ